MESLSARLDKQEHWQTSNQKAIDELLRLVRAGNAATNPLPDAPDAGASSSGAAG